VEYEDQEQEGEDDAAPKHSRRAFKRKFGAPKNKEEEEGNENDDGPKSRRKGGGSRREEESSDFNNQDGDDNAEDDAAGGDDEDSATPKRVSPSEVKRKFPFLKGAPAHVVRRFSAVLTDDNIVTNAQRNIKLHYLAISYLNTDQLEAYEKWASKEKRKLAVQERRNSKRGGNAADYE